MRCAISAFRLHRIHEMRTIDIDNLLAWESVRHHFDAVKLHYSLHLFYAVIIVHVNMERVFCRWRGVHVLKTLSAL